jgi:hypothetical protein
MVGREELDWTCATFIAADAWSALPAAALADTLDTKRKEKRKKYTR